MEMFQQLLWSRVVSGRAVRLPVAPEAQGMGATPLGGRAATDSRGSK